MAPIAAVANCTMTHSCRFGDQMPTRSPFHAPGHQAPRDDFRLFDELAIGRAVVLLRDDQSLAITDPSRGSSQVLKDGLAQKRFIAGPVNVAQFKHPQPPWP
jgi:hypothetical protein